MTMTMNMNRFVAAMFALCLPVFGMLAAPAQAQTGFTGDLPKALEADTETSIWLSVAYTRNAAELEYYLAQYPDGKYAQVARQKLDHLDHNFRNSSLRNMENYLKSYPDGRYTGVAEAKQRRENMIFWFIFLLLIPVGILGWVLQKKLYFPDH